MYIFVGAKTVDPTIACYNASAVKIYKATSSLVRFEDKKLFLQIWKKRSSLLQRQLCSCKFESRRICSKIQSYDLSYNASAQ
jgi:hypothetical protein